MLVGPGATVYGGVAILLLVAATWLPAHRATRVSPLLPIPEE